MCVLNCSYIYEAAWAKWHTCSLWQPGAFTCCLPPPEDSFTLTCMYEQRTFISFSLSLSHNHLLSVQAIASHSLFPYDQSIYLYCICFTVRDLDSLQEFNFFLIFFYNRKLTCLYWSSGLGQRIHRRVIFVSVCLSRFYLFIVEQGKNHSALVGPMYWFFFWLCS